MSRGLGSAAVAVACCAVAARADPSSAEIGRSLFEGRAPLVAHIVGQDVALPVQASRCVNCHLDAAPNVGAASSGAASRRLGPTLTAVGLREPARRRGGPPSRYDSEAFCRLLRTGVDPASVIVDRSMPRYEIDTADCEALWAHLTTRQ